MKYPKHKPLRLKGKKLTDLYRQVYDRDDGTCQHPDCFKWIEPGTPPHHIVFKSQGGEDLISNLEMLCYKHHYAKHHGGKHE